VTVDTVFGGAHEIRHYLEERRQPFVLAVPSTQRVSLSATAEGVAAAWQRLLACDGSQGPRWYDWAWMPAVA
jgi:hypothetical protein